MGHIRYEPVLFTSGTGQLTTRLWRAGHQQYRMPLAGL